MVWIEILLAGNRRLKEFKGKIDGSRIPDVLVKKEHQGKAVWSEKRVAKRNVDNFEGLIIFRGEK